MIPAPGRAHHGDEWREFLVPVGIDARHNRSMLAVCPTDVVDAPAERIWDLVATPRELARWSDTRVVDAPDREVRHGDRFVLGAGIGHLLSVTFHVRDAVRPRTLAIDIRLPLGVMNAEVIQITPVGPAACRVAFN
jgi:uncharacterized protein YndB with AHSA1/START domain